MPDHCIESVLKIRFFLTEQIGKTSQNKSVYKDIQQLRASCRKFLDTAQDMRLRGCHRYVSTDEFIFISALGELRGVFGIVISKMAVSYGIDIYGDLVKIIPIDNI